MRTSPTTGRSLLSRAAAILAAAAAGAALITAPAHALDPLPGTLRGAAALSGRFAGLGATAEGLSTEYPQIAAREFSSITPGNEMKWGSLEPTRGNYNWGPADSMVAFAQQHRQEVHGHTLVWHHQLPYWVENTDFAPGELLDEMRRHITTTVGRYAGDIARWDVVNEPFNEDGSLRDSIFHREIGPDYIAEALRAAHAADPDAKLYINDYNVEGLNAKSDALYRLAGDLLDQGVPLHGVGLQSHLIVGQVPADMAQNMQRFVDLGLEVAVTELDVRIPLPADENELAQQAEDYAAVAAACMSVNGCVGVTVWGVSNCCSWIPDTFPGYGHAHLWDEDYQPTGAYYALLKALGGAGAPGGPGGPGGPDTPGSDCTVDYRVTSVWDQGAVVQVIVVPSEPLNGWAVEFTLAAGTRVAQYWNTDLALGQDGRVTARNLGWNGTVAANSPLDFGFVTDGNNPVPTSDILLNGVPCRPA